MPGSYLAMGCRSVCQWPYHLESTGSHLNTKVKQDWAGLVPGWETTWEHPVLLTFCMYCSRQYITNNMLLLEKAPILYCAEIIISFFQKGKPAAVHW